MMEAPGLRRCAYAIRTTLKLPSRSMSTTVLNALGDMSSARARKLPAAPETSTSIGPKRSQACASARSTASGWRTSAEMPMACVPSASSCAAAADTLSAERLIRLTRAPARAKACAMPKLMPLEPPATNSGGR